MIEPSLCRRILFVTLLLALPAVSVAAPLDPAIGTVSSSLQLPAASAVVPQPGAPLRDPLREALLNTPAAFSGTATGDAVSDNDGDDDDLQSDSGEGEDAPALLDPQAVEEAKILTDEESVPPEDEGQTTPSLDSLFDFPVVENQKVQYYVDYFTGPGREVFSRWLERSSRYLPYMQEVFAAHGLPRDLVYLSIVESGLNPKAYSWAHASGPWQFIYSTGKLYGMENDYWWDERRDFEKSTEAAALYLKELYQLFNGDWYLAVAAYNGGPGTMLRAIEKTGERDFWKLAHTPHVPLETKNYVPKLLAVLLVAKQPEKYGFVEIPYQQPIVCDRVVVPTPTDLAVVASLTGSSYEEIKALNPELKRWCTPPKKENYEIKIPAGTRDLFLSAFELLPEAERSSYTLHRVEKGETLKSIARDFQIGVDDILTVNRISDPKSVKVGRNLVIPQRSDLPALALEDLREDPSLVKLAKIKTYKVKKGDTLSKVAGRSGVSVAQLQKWNRLKKSSVLRIGQTLLLGPGKGSGRPVVAAGGGKSAKAKSSGKSGKSAKSPGKKTTQAVYTVKKGDTLYSIARRHEVTPEMLRDWNRLSRQQVLRPGQSLTIHSPGRSGG